MKPTMVADEMFPEGPPYTDVETDAGETTVFQQVHSEDFYKGEFGLMLLCNFASIDGINHFQDSMICLTRTT